jgi:hypothetical protein
MLVWIALAPAAVSVVAGAIIELTMNDLRLRGTQIGDVSIDSFGDPQMCSWCHGDYDEGVDAFATWSGSLMGLAGRDPLFYAQMTNANQDVANAGNFCMRCHVPMSFVTGHAMPADGSALDARDLEGVSCHFCHSMVDPVYRAGVSPAEDEAILAALQGGPPEFYANAMFVLDGSGARRGPLADAQSPHESIPSAFHTSGNFCGTCHDVGNVAVSRRPDGTYRYNALDAPTPSENPATQFPLERTYTEWRLSDFARGGVDLGGRFGGVGITTVSTCQDCHMPVRPPGQACFYGPEREGLRSHSFAGASAQVLDLIAEQYRGDDAAVDPVAVARGREAAVSMLQRAATLELSQSGADLVVRVVNQSGHKLPTGHIEGRRVWVRVRFVDDAGRLVREHGGYDEDAAHLDEGSSTVFEMRVGLSDDAARLTGLPAGPTGHMALADTIVKDNRIPPRGFANAAYEGAGAPVVGAAYADGQHWSDVRFRVPARTARAEVALYYQNTPRHYIEELRDNNHTNDTGRVLHDLWERTGRGAPIEMAAAQAQVKPPCPADWDANGTIDSRDFFAFLAAFFGGNADLNGDGLTTSQDFFDFLRGFFGGC